MTLPSPLPMRNDPEMIPQTPPRVEKIKKTHSPVTYISKDETPKRPIRDRLGEKPATPITNISQDETPRRPIRDRLGEKHATPSRPVRERLDLRRSKRKEYVEPFNQGFAPRRDSEFNRDIWDHGPDGHWFPVQDKDSDEPSEQEEK